MCENDFALIALIAILLQNFTVPLKEELKRIKKPVYGVKAVLVKRLIDYYTKESVNNTEAILHESYNPFLRSYECC